MTKGLSTPSDRKLGQQKRPSFPALCPEGRSWRSEFNAELARAVLPASLENLPWCDGHGFIVDFFLYDLAHSGYVLQKSQKKFDFKDMEKDIQIYKNKVSDNLASILKATKNFNEA